MRNHFFFCILVAMVGFFACQPTQQTQEPDAKPMINSNALEGTWKITTVQPQDTNIMMPADFTQYKIYTKDRMFFVAYDETKNQFLLAGGGSYAITGDTLLETINFLSLDTTAVGAVFNFKLTVDSTNYHQSGILPPLTGTEDSIIIEESYQLAEPSIGFTNGQNPLIGLWKNEKAAYGDAETAEPLPGGFVSYKIFTPGHFYVTQYNPESGSFDGMVFGKYTITGNQFEETILATSRDSSIIGLSITYDIEADGSSLTQKGMVNNEAYPNFKIEEHFSRVE